MTADEALGMHMSRWPSRHILVASGTVACSLVILWSTLGIVLYGGDMIPNLIAELAGVSLEIAIAILVIERLVSRHQRWQWDFAYRALARRACETFVDVMRLVFVGSSSSTLEENLPRYQEYIDICQQHLGELRSHIEGSASALDFATHEDYRRVERRLSWCLGQLKKNPRSVGVDPDLISLLRETAIEIFELMVRSDGSHEAILMVAESSVARARSSRILDHTQSGLLTGRLAAQTFLLEGLGPRQRQIFSISQDVDNDYSIPYFMIDYLLLTTEQQTSAWGE
ncbi:hypothetical protein AGRA3207_007281 [Actinomadura graeca]|uniref:Uncharacterized protein n=1 Tax=Actinomadura graeca TaxID=2750812 RepID=A0ABX8R3W5_9ACTN|nr:hypothetical protein [Actinomadura graeca]QXJ25742.1 hypothetical protein AGRA3207_007281 [Actinomadura graeca]